jgi:uncharacterized protein YbjQ (UPF0145 family)
MANALLYYLIVINVMTFLIYGIDKWKANVIVGIDIDYETVGANGSMLMVATSGTAVVSKMEIPFSDRYK